LSRLHKELGTTMIYVTHDQVEAMTMGTRIAVFNQGRIEQLGAPLDLYNAPANEFVAGFLGAPRINLVDRPGSGAPGAHQALFNALLPAAAPAAARLGLRAEHLRIVAAGEGVPATLVMAEHLGDESILHLRVDGIDELLNAKVAAGQEALAAGQALGLRFDPSWVLAFDAQGRRL
jgi:multiple sugar transport system ATP-binding protein